jgi:LemA protein
MSPLGIAGGWKGFHHADWPGIVVVVVVLMYLMFAYNGLVRLKVQCDNAWSDIDVQLKRRYDLIPNIVETVKGYASHEKGTLEGVVAARNQAMSAQGPAAKGEAEGALTGALRQVFALAEAYPQLRAVESFTQLQATLNQIEDTLQNARRYYNAVVRDFNTMIEQFPPTSSPGWAISRNANSSRSALPRNAKCRRSASARPARSRHGFPIEAKAENIAQLRRLKPTRGGALKRPG